MFPPTSPTSIAGQLETEIRQVKNDLRSKANDYEVRTLSNRVDALVSAVRDVSSVCNGILSRLETCEKRTPNKRRIKESKINTGCSDCDKNFIINGDMCPKCKLDYLRIMAEQAQKDYLEELKAQSRKVKK